MAVTDDSAARILAKCARHCCICRRFRPLHLQVHHIIERHDGGSDDVDNLIAICVTCHSDVHTSTKLTRRFTVSELKMHREAVFELVSSGRLPAGDIEADSMQELSARIVDQLRSLEDKLPALKPEIPSKAMELLLAAVCEAAPIQISRFNQGLMAKVNTRAFNFPDLIGPDAYPPLIEMLLSRGLLKEDDVQLHVTHAGYALVDDIESSEARFTMKKIKCLSCHLHFIICTWYPDRHRAENIICPECGQRSGHFMVGQQQEFGYIFQHVPGHALPLEF